MSLPKGYKRLEYIQSSGTQYVDSKFVPNQDTRVEMDVVPLSIAEAGGSTGFIPYGAATSYNSNAFECYTTSSKLSFNYDGQYTVNGTITVGTVIHVSHNKNVVLVTADGATVVEKTFTYQAFTAPYSLTVCASHRSSMLCGHQRVKNCQIYDNGTLVRDFIPCQNASGAVGLWDAENEVFYGNAGTGTFTAGPVVPETVDESEITELEYIQSSGTQYFKTGFLPSSKSRVVMEFESLVSGVDAGLCGARTTNASKAFCFWFYTNYITSARFDYSKVNPITTAVPSSNKRITLDMNQNTCVCDNFSETQSVATFQCDYDLALFGINTAGTVGSLFTGRMYSGQAYDNGLLERDFVPAMLSNGEVGLYDRVFHAFYRNAGTGEFIAGPEAATAPKAPTNFRVESETDSLVTLAWDASNKAVGYRLYRSGQLLADTEETSVSVAVEPFAGAVFTLTAYNENGEGAGSTLTYFSIPANPILFLITDRTQQDVTERNPKGYYAASDLNRVGFAVEHLQKRLLSAGVSVTVSPVLTWTDEEWATPAAMTAYLKDVQTMRSALKVVETTPAAPEDMAKLTYSEANDIEAILVALDVHITRMLSIVDAGWASGLAYTGFYFKEAY